MYSISGPGTIVAGTTQRGTIREGDNLLLGPNDDGAFIPVTAHTIHRNRLPCRIVSAGQTAAVSLGNLNSTLIRKVCCIMAIFV